MEIFFSGMDIMNIVEIFGIYDWLVSIISENKKLDKFCEGKNIETPKNNLLLHLTVLYT